VQRGTALELTLTGTNLADPTGLWTSFPAKVTIPTDRNNGKDNGALRVRLEVPPDAPLGFHTIRLATRRGLSNFRIFCVDDLPQIRAVDTNRTKATPQPVPIPCVVVGRADPEASDYFKITVKAGQRVSVEILGRRLGSPLDPQIALLDRRSQRELAFSNDAPGLQTDARLTHTFKEAGDYLLEVRDTTYGGGPDYWYRLRIGDFPCATTPIPMAARRGTKTTVTFAGPLTDGVAPVEVTVPADPAAAVVWVAPRWPGGLHGWPVPLAVSDLDEVVESEPNNDPAKANRIPVPCGVTGRFQEKGDVDHFVFAAKKGQRYLARARTHEFSSPTEVYMALKNAAGAQIAATNPAAEPVIDFTAPADGDLTLSVEHLNYWGGPDESYRLTVTPYAPGFQLALGIDRYDIPQGGMAVVPIQSVTRRDYPGPIEVSVVGGLPGVTGTTVITAEAPAPGQPAALLTVSARPDVPLGPYTLHVQGKATIGGKVVVAYASLKGVVSQGLADLPFPPPDLFNRVGVAITEKPPFTLAAKFDRPEGVRGMPVGLTITAARAPGFAEEIALAPLGLPANVTPGLKNIPRGQSEVKVQLTPAANAPLGRFLISVTGRAKFQNRDYQVPATPVDLVLALPFDLKAVPAELRLSPGSKAKLRVTAARKGGYAGPIDLALRNLPAGVAAAKAAIAAGQNAADIELTATATAAVAARADANVLGTAPAAANQQNASPNFTVSVVKK
jgi:hypothetical protein